MKEIIEDLKRQIEREQAQLEKCNERIGEFEERKQTELTEAAQHSKRIATLQFAIDTLTKASSDAEKNKE